MRNSLFPLLVLCLATLLVGCGEATPSGAPPAVKEKVTVKVGKGGEKIMTSTLVR